MPFMKYKPLRQWGRFNTRIFKAILKARNKRSLNKPLISEEYSKLDIRIYDPTEPGFFKKLENDGEPSEPSPSNAHLPPELRRRSIQDDPLYKKAACLLFDGTIPMVDGVDEACALIKATPAKPLPDSVLAALPSDFLPPNFEKEVIDSILAGERFDPTLEKLPRQLDPVVFWIKRSLVYGIPVQKRNSVIMSQLCRKVSYLATSKRMALGHFRLDRDTALSGYISSSDSGLGAPIVFRHEPQLVYQSEFAPKPLASKNDVDVSRSIPVPNVYPISPVIDLSKTNIYNKEAILPRKCIDGLHLNTVFSSRDYSSYLEQKYPWTMEQFAANAICHCFCAAFVQATRTPNLLFSDPVNKVLERPIVAKYVQLSKGRFDLVVVQLNTLKLDPNHSDSVKNFVWLEKAAQLYTTKPHWETFNEVTDLNMDTFRKFVSLLLYF